MRNVKYRALDINDKWIYWTPEDEVSEWSGEVTFWQQLQNYFGLSNLCEYIGIKDVNGKKIFEGDKVKHSEGINYIEYDEDSAMFVLDCYSGKPLHHNMPFEVIGNILQDK